MEPTGTEAREIKYRSLFPGGENNELPKKFAERKIQNLLHGISFFSASLGSFQSTGETSSGSSSIIKSG